VSPLRILTVRQPWAWAIIHGGKDVENRVRNLAGNYRGPIAIHAGLSCDDRGWIDKGGYHLTRRMGGTFGGATASTTGVILGVVNLTGVHHADRDALECAEAGGHDTWCSKWADPGVWHLTLSNPRPLAETIPYKGALGLRTLPDDVAALVLERVTS
jgi:hypothetical protein